MLSKTSIQAMYINRVKDREKLCVEYDKLIDRRFRGDDVDEEIYSTELELNYLANEIGLLFEILGLEDTPEVSKNE